MPLRFDLPPWMFYSFLFIIGAIIGSFLNVCVYRIPTHEKLLDQLRALWNRPSHCPRCDAQIRWVDNIPVFGWVKLGGRCRDCRMKISPRYPLVEFFNGCLFVLVFWFEVPLEFRSMLSDSCVFSPIGPQVHPGLGRLSPELFVLLRYAFHMVMIEALVAASLIDFDLRIIPDGVTVPAMIFAVIMSTIFGTLHLVPVWVQNIGVFEILLPENFAPYVSGEPIPDWINAYPHLHGFVVSVVGLIVGGGVVWGVRLMGFLFLKEEAMGFGDVVLMAMVGAFLGWQATTIAFFIAPVFALASVVLTSIFVRNRAIPYGPYLSLGTLFTILFWPKISPVGMRIFELGVILIPLVGVMTILFGLSLGLVYTIKRMFGLLPPEETSGVWRAADQACFVAGEKVNRDTCLWKSQTWEGSASGRGTIHEERWRAGHDDSFRGTSSTGYSLGSNRKP